MGTKKTGFFTPPKNSAAVSGVEDSITLGELRQYERIVSATPDPISLIDRKYVYQMANDAYLRAHGKVRDQVLGRTVADVWGQDLFEKTIRRFIDRGFQGETVNFSGEFLFGNLGPRFINVTYYPFIDQEGSIQGVVVNSRDITERKQAEEALRESEARFRTLASNIPGVSYRCLPDEHWTMVFISNEIETLSGYPASDFISNRKRVYTSIIHPDDVKLTEKIVLDGLERKEVFIAEYRIVHADGDIRWVFEKGQGIFREDGELVYLDGVILDITERKQAEKKIKASLKEKEILLREVHHRVKNNMQVITSLLSLQASRTGNKEAVAALQESQQRVRSMAMAHERLYRSKDLAHLKLSGYVSSLVSGVAQLFSTDPNRITVQIQVADIPVNMDQAVPLGLIINELVTNALKYAFPEGGSGTLTISIEPKGEDEVALVVADDGVGIPEELDWRNTDTLGLMLATNLCQQIRGSILLDRSNGTRWQIVFMREEL